MASELLQHAVSVLQQGGIIAYPTEAVFGLGCDPHNETTVMRLLSLKARPISKGLILVAANSEQLKPYLAPVAAKYWEKAQASWPGPVTWLFPSRQSVSRALRGAHNTIAVRVSANPLIQSLCLAFGGAIISTSANKSGQSPSRSVAEVHAQFGNEIDMILPGEVDHTASPSVIRDLLTDHIIRPSNT